MKPWEIKRLTLFQLRELYFCERNEYGTPILKGSKSAPPVTPKQLHWIHGRRIGLTERQIERKWKAKNGH